MAIPTKDTLLVPFLNNMSARLTASPTTFGLVAGQAAELYSRKQAYVNAYDTLVNARADGTRSESQTQDKDTKKERVLAYARELYALVSSNNSVTDANKVLLGVHVRKSGNTPVPVPSVRPGMDLVSVVGRTISVHIHDSASSAKRGKPAGAVTAWVYSFVGENYPSDPSDWNFHGAANKEKFDFTLPGSTPNGAQVWICAAWVNGKNQAGPPSVPLTTNIQGGGMSSGASMKIAA